VFLTTAI